jgi:hypothetical protein
LRRESVAECEKARQIDPLVKINSSAMNSYLYLGEYGEFLHTLPANDSVYINFYRGFGEYYLNNRDQAAQEFDRAFEKGSFVASGKCRKSPQLFNQGATMRTV